MSRKGVTFSKTGLFSSDTVTVFAEPSAKVSVAGLSILSGS